MRRSTGILVIVATVVIAAAAVSFVVLRSDEAPTLPVVNEPPLTNENWDGPPVDGNGDENGEEPLPTGEATVVRTVSTSQKMVVLTFDAGADRGFAPDILDTLKTEGIKASFGMTGKWAEANPDLVRRIAADGHDFINHTWSHESLTGFSTNATPLSREERWRELSRTEELIVNLSGKSTKPFFRPPYGDYNDSVNADIYAQGYMYNIMWTVDSLGWKGLSKEEIKDRVVGGTVPGAIHLFHVGEQSQDAAALLDIIRELRSRGYTFARISDLL